MKRLLFLLLTIATIFTVETAHAQAPYGKAFVFPLIAGDTLNNIDTVAKVIPATAGYSTLGIQANLNKLSGTLTTGLGCKLYLYRSINDSRNYVLVDSALYVAVPVGAAGSVFGATNGYTHTAQITVDRSPGVYYLVAATSTGTVSAAVQIGYTARQYFITRP